jgi:hypothetical protein
MAPTAKQELKTFFQRLLYVAHANANAATEEIDTIIMAM